MKKLKLKLNGIAETLTREQMKKINGGYTGYTCECTGGGGGNNLADPCDNPSYTNETLCGGRGGYCYEAQCCGECSL